MSITKLQDKNVVVNTTPVEIDFAVNEIRKELATISWVDYPFFIAQRFYRKKENGTFVFPETYAPDSPGSRKYHRLTPDKDYKGSFFFLVGPGRIEYNANEFNFITHRVSIIFSVNLEKIDATKLDAGLFTQELVRDARRKLTTTMIKHEFDYVLLTETRDLLEVYREFRLEDLVSYNRAPMQCFRFELDVRIQEDC